MLKLAIHKRQVIRLLAEDVRDIVDSLVTAATVTVVITKGDGTPLTLSVITESPSGTYYVDYEILSTDPTGDYVAEWRIVKGGFTLVKRYGFTVVA